jgi:hypothetical protein
MTLFSQHEMALVQDTDVDRNFDDYLMQIATLADNHLSLLSTLRKVSRFRVKIFLLVIIFLTDSSPPTLVS